VLGILNRQEVLTMGKVFSGTGIGMRVVVAGATGAIGRRLVSALVAAGHEVIGMTHSDRGARMLAEAGADAVVVDALDAAAVAATLERIQPHAIIDELTSLPKHYTPDEMRAAAPRDHQVRIEGGASLLRATQASGARRYLLQSSGFFLAPGPGLADEQAPFAVEASSQVAEAARIYAQIERRSLETRGLDVVALRYGFFYGPGTWYTQDGNMTAQVRQQRFPLIGNGRGVWSFVHVDDAAGATVAALDCAPGIYNIVDSQPSELAEWLPAFARDRTALAVEAAS
jgi:2-alkyl-3-oxoalkanoate reductase